MQPVYYTGCKVSFSSIPLSNPVALSSSQLPLKPGKSSQSITQAVQFLFHLSLYLTQLLYHQSQLPLKPGKSSQSITQALQFLFHLFLYLTQLLYHQVSYL
jgi:hypothetical protein